MMSLEGGARDWFDVFLYVVQVFSSGIVAIAPETQCLRVAHYCEHCKRVSMLMYSSTAVFLYEYSAAVDFL